MSITPPSDNQPTEAYAAGYGQPAPAESRSKRIAWTALALAIAGVVAAGVALVPMLWMSFGLALLAGLLLLSAFIVALIGLVVRRNGGKGISVAALLLSILGSVVAGVALFLALLLIGFDATDNSIEPSPEVSAAPSPSATDDATPLPSETPTATAPDAAAEAAFLAEVRPKVNDIMAQTDPPITPEIVATVLPDAQLLLIGQGLLSTGEDGIDTIVDQTVVQIGDVVPADTLRQLYETVLASAQTHLQ